MLLFCSTNVCINPSSVDDIATRH